MPADGGPSLVVGRPALGRGPARCDPALPAESSGPRAQPVPPLSRDVGRVGCVRRDRYRLSLQREGPRRGRARRTQRGGQLRGVPRPDGPLHQGCRRRHVAFRVRRSDGRALLSDLGHRYRWRFTGCGRQPDREGGARLREDGRLERAERLHRSQLCVGQSAACRSETGDHAGRPEPMAAAPDRAHAQPERHRAGERGSAGRRAALGPCGSLRHSRRRHIWHAHRSRAAAASG